MAFDPWYVGLMLRSSDRIPPDYLCRENWAVPILFQEVAHEYEVFEAAAGFAEACCAG